MLTDVNLSDGIVYQFTINRLFLLNLSVESCNHKLVRTYCDFFACDVSI